MVISSSAFSPVFHFHFRSLCLSFQSAACYLPSLMVGAKTPPPPLSCSFSLRCPRPSANEMLWVSRKKLPLDSLDVPSWTCPLNAKTGRLYISSPVGVRWRGGNRDRAREVRRDQGLGLLYVFRHCYTARDAPKKQNAFCPSGRAVARNWIPCAITARTLTALGL